MYKQLGRVKSTIKHFFQRLIKGYDDSETWNMDLSFYRWLYPRLKRFTILCDNYPARCKNLSEWTDEIEDIVDLLRKIINEDYFFSIESDEDKRKVMDWFHNNVDHLWW